jgi:hypothetical protein
MKLGLTPSGRELNFQKFLHIRVYLRESVVLISS